MIRTNRNLVHLDVSDNEVGLEAVREMILEVPSFLIW